MLEIIGPREPASSSKGLHPEASNIFYNITIKLRTKQASNSRGYGGNISCLSHHATILNCVPGYNEIMLIKAVCNSI